MPLFNNDLPTASELMKMTDDTETYEKVGGYHREDGYYLESVDESVKLIWQRKSQVKSKENRREEKITKFEKLEINLLTQDDFINLLKMEETIYPEDFIQGQTLLEEIKGGNGLEYSMVISGIPEGETVVKPIGYLVAVEDRTDEGDPTIYLEDIAVLPEARGQGAAWIMIKELIFKLQTKAKKENKPVLWDMHLREASQRLLEKHKDDLIIMGVQVIEEAFVSDYYEGEDAVYKVYEVSVPKT